MFMFDDIHVHVTMAVWSLKILLPLGSEAGTSDDQMVLPKTKQWQINLESQTSQKMVVTTKPSNSTLLECEIS